MSFALAKFDPKLRRTDVGQSKSPSSCRPWDRGDLFRRLATFKSMTWFAKPEAVSAVNCARRGWVNVDMDTIACEACSSRLLFATPPSWTHQQVEKAALVFSLKLNSGHKLLCPWVDNMCDERLMLFPPTPANLLVDDYKKRFASLMKLLALPAICSSAINYSKSPQFVQFLEGSSTVEILESTDQSRTDYTGNEPETVSSRSYRQSQKLISLFGWEPRILPYMVDCNGQTNHRLSIHSSVRDESTSANNGTGAPAEEISDPSSVVLECKFCGACVGLWAFATVPRPIEFHRIVGYTEVGSENDAYGHKDSMPGNILLDGENTVHNVASTSSVLINHQTSNLNLTIAGGPPPTKQNYRATVSLPIIGRNLRARFLTETELRCHLQVKNCEVGTSQDTPQEVIVTEQGNFAPSGPDVTAEDKLRSPASGSCKMDIFLGNAGNTRVDPAVGNHCSPVEYHSSSLDENVNKHTENIDCTEGGERPNKRDSGVAVDKLHPINSEVLPSSVKDLQCLPLDKAMEFDPIRQHRPFCPWISSSCKSAPGWQQTMNALERHEDFSYRSPKNTSSLSLTEVDDPVAFVKELFSPPAKRKKLSHPG